MPLHEDCITSEGEVEAGGRASCATSDGPTEPFARREDTRTAVEHPQVRLGGRQFVDRYG